MTKKKTLVVVDGMAYIFRSFYGTPELSNAEGTPLNAVMGYVRALLKAEKDFNPDFAVVAFDSPGKTFREDIHKAYKANRDAPPDPLVPQFPLCEETTPMLGWTLLREDGFEADDIMALLVEKGLKENLDIILMTGDKDMLQLIQPGVRVYREGRMGGKMYGPAETVERFGVKPDQILDLLGLMGDTSDNIPGVPGVGEKTAASLLQEYGTMDKVLANAKNIKKPKLSANLQEFADQARLSRRLAQLETNIPIKFKIEDLARRERDWAPLIQQLEHFEFRSMLKNIREAAPKDLGPIPSKPAAKGAGPAIKNSKAKKDKLEVVYDVGAFKRACVDAKINVTRPVGFATWPAEKPNRLAVWQRGAAVVLEGDHEDCAEAASPFGAAFIYGSKPLQIERMRLNLSTLDNVFDVEVGAYLLNATKAGRDLNGAAHLAGVAGEMLPDLNDDLIGPAPAAMVSHARTTLEAGEVIVEGLKKDKLDKLYDELEGPLITVLARMQLDGIKVDEKILTEIDIEIQKTLKKLEKKAHKLAGHEFNLNSPSQLATILFEELKLDTGKKTKTGFSTNEEVLEQLTGDHELPGVILENRTLTKLSGTYLQALPKLIAEDGRIHSHWNQTIAATGRLSSKDPNLQNIPVRTELGRSTRKAFVPGKKSDSIFAADYSQIELRVLAHFCKDKTMKEAFESGLDIHTRTAAQVFGINPDKIDSEQRRRAKIINFGILYGMGPFRLSKDLGIAMGEARAFIEAYFNGFPKIRDYLESIKEGAEKNGYVTTILGRRRYIPEIASGNRVQREAGLRAALNMPIQGSAADLIKVAMLKVAAMLAKKKAKSKMLLQVHDELVLEMDAAEKGWLPGAVVKIMENAMELRVPLKVSQAVGKNWYDAKG